MSHDSRQQFGYGDKLHVDRGLSNICAMWMRLTLLFSFYFFLWLLKIPLTFSVFIPFMHCILPIVSCFPVWTIWKKSIKQSFSFFERWKTGTAQTMPPSKWDAIKEIFLTIQNLSKKDPLLLPLQSFGFQCLEGCEIFWNICKRAIWYIFLGHCPLLERNIRMGNTCPKQCDKMKQYKCMYFSGETEFPVNHDP